MQTDVFGRVASQLHIRRVSDVMIKVQVAPQYTYQMRTVASKISMTTWNSNRGRKVELVGDKTRPSSTVGIIYTLAKQFPSPNLSFAKLGLYWHRNERSQENTKRFRKACCTNFEFFFLFRSFGVPRGRVRIFLIDLVEDIDALKTSATNDQGCLGGSQGRWGGEVLTMLSHHICPRH